MNPIFVAAAIASTNKHSGRTRSNYNHHHQSYYGSSYTSKPYHTRRKTKKKETKRIRNHGFHDQGLGHYEYDAEEDVWVRVDSKKPPKKKPPKSNLHSKKKSKSKPKKNKIKRLWDKIKCKST